MSGHLVVMVVEVFGCLLSASYALPQLVRLLVTRQVDGLSGPALVVPPLASMAWIGYFFWQARYGVLISDFLYLPSELLLIAALVRAGGTGLRTWAAAAGAAGVFALAAATGHPVVLATVLTAMAAVQYALAIAAAHRAKSTSGISAPSWWISLASGSLWLPYGILLGDVGVAEWSALTLAASLVVLARLAVDRRWLRRAGTPAAVSGSAETLAPTGLAALEVTAGAADRAAASGWPAAAAERPRRGAAWRHPATTVAGRPLSP